HRSSRRRGAPGGVPSSATERATAPHPVDPQVEPDGGLRVAPHPVDLAIDLDVDVDLEFELEREREREREREFDVAIDVDLDLDVDLAIGVRRIVDHGSGRP
ncbi:MAG: hypothetical protein ABMB14_41040, partial [Myxococcota bacterium]